jgi:hypothetical protein
MRRVALISFVLALSASAQVNKSNLTGIVRDTTDAVVPGVTIKLTSLDTGAVRTESSDDSGFYRFTLVDRGRYRLDAERSGFKRFQQPNVELQTGETTTVNIALVVGELAESVTVSSEVATLRTETGAIGTTVSTQVMNELPLIGRNPYVFLTLSPGIQYTGDPGALNPWDVAGPSAFAASGSEAKSEFLLDGIPNMGISNVSLSPSPDAVQEMRVQTSAFGRGVRACRRGLHQREHALGHQRVSRHGVLVSSQRQSECQQLLQQSRGIEKDRVQAEHLRRIVRRPVPAPQAVQRPRQDPLLFQLRRHADSRQRTGACHCADRTRARRRFLAHLRPQQPAVHHLRSRHHRRPIPHAVPGQRHSRETASTRSP